MDTQPSQRSVIATDESDGSPSSTIRMNSEKKKKLPPHFRGLDRVFRESFITNEYCAVTRHTKLGGVYVIPSQQSPTLWFGVIFVHHGLYQGGVFRFTLNIPESFPESSSVPIVTFQPPVFHPSIHLTHGTFDLRRHFKSWNRSQNHIWQILKVVRGAFYKIEGSTVNKAANDMYENDPGQFVTRAQREVESSLKRVYDTPSEFARDSHWIKFSEYDPRIHDPVRAKALKPIQNLNGTFTNLTNRSSVVTSPRGTSFL